jgi:hypothetical protein
VTTVKSKTFASIFAVIVGLGIATTIRAAGDNKPLAGVALQDPILGVAVSDRQLRLSAPFAPIIKVADTGNAGSANGLRTGDLLLAMGGYRIFEPAERLINPAWVKKEAEVKFTVLRDGEIVTATVSTAVLSKAVAVQTEYIRTNVLQSLERRLGPLAPGTRQSLVYFPIRACLLIEEWATAQPFPQPPPPWLREFMDLYVAMVNQEYEKVQSLPPAAPIPYLNRLAKFYLSIAREHRDVAKRLDWKKHGESLDFFVINFPWPCVKLPPLGKPSLSDKDLLASLEMLATDPLGNYSHLVEHAKKYVTKGFSDQDLTQGYVHLVCTSILHPYGHEGWPYRHQALHEADTRGQITATLRERVKERDRQDWILDAYALTSPLTILDRKDEVLALLKDMYEQSPFLTVLAVRNIANTSDYWSRGSNTAKAAGRFLKDKKLPATAKPFPFFQEVLAVALAKHPKYHVHGSFVSAEFRFLGGVDSLCIHSVALAREILAEEPPASAP